MSGAGRPAVAVEDADPSSGPAARLMDDLGAELVALYGDGEDPTSGFAPDQVRDRGAFVLATSDGEPVGCGALRRIDGDTAELKRMYVVPARRGEGVSRVVLAALEGRAAALGYRRLRLETGVRQPAAIALYEGAGYRRTGPFGGYPDCGLSVFFAKDLSAAPDMPG